MNCNTPGMLTLFYYIKMAINIIFIGAPILLLLLGTIDFLKAVTSGNEKDMKKSVDDFVKRVIICVLIFILPLLVNLVMSVVNVKSYKECYVNATRANIEKLDEEYKKKQEEEENNTPSGDSDTNKTTLNIATGKHLKNYNNMDYYEVIPPHPTTGMPLVIFLHGDGEYYNFSSVSSLKLMQFVTSGQAYVGGKEFMFIAPHGAKNDWYSDGITNQLLKLIDHVTSEYNIDTSRIYLTGHSRGGMGVWSIANRYPGKFSAIVPISGTGNINASNFANTRVKAYASSDSSDNWCYSNSRDNCNKIKAAGGDCEFISLSVHHGNTANTAYNVELFNWLLNGK